MGGEAEEGEDEQMNEPSAPVPVEEKKTGEPERLADWDAMPDECFKSAAPSALAEKDVARVVAGHVAKPREPYISEWNWASDAGHPCVRYLAYRRLYPERALPISEDLAFTFRRGHYVEREALDELRDAGYELVEQQRPFTDRRLKVKGKIDCKVVLHVQNWTHKYPLEIKSYAPGTWKAVKTARDFLDSGIPYLMAVPAQVTLYLLIDQTAGQEALLYMKNKLTGLPKQMVIPLDSKYAMWLWKRLRVVNEHVRRKKLPERIKYDEGICGRCAFRATCLQEMPAGPSPLVLDPERHGELLDLLAERERLHPLSKAYEEVHDRVKEIVKGIPKLIVGDWIVTGQEITMPPQNRKGYTYWRASVVNVKKQAPEE